ncbi:RluA family pseudouridine synthase [Paenibacillus eucommiae]|uniref:Pseudouridine synthase n=1 Tax=Paenibacillus eucommiae TaxID=1355755 RepID=A0ABS4J7V1_9BACL|nr:RluA family pseudouridine synthase [Paenibacillus eucommiae]MBP1995932.1 23S rRNA pseudouridine1911/1915/1917 synthase [Paenibacillus eucommiae]
MISWKRKGEWMELSSPIPGWSPADADSCEKLALHVPVPQKLYHKLARGGGVKLQGGRPMLRLFQSEKSPYVPEYAELDVLFEDDFCLVINKPAGMSVHPSEAGQQGTLAAAVAFYYESTGQACSVRHIHRLDRDTTGAVLYAKNEWAHLLLDEAMREKRIERIYTGVAEGMLASAAGVIREPIGRDRHHSGKRRVTPGGDAAVTHYTVLDKSREASLLELRLETGRTHQIRVHLSHLGHPLWGDSLYGAANTWTGRQALHGKTLLFHHPVSQESISVSAPLPEDFVLLLSKLRIY